MWWLVIVGLVGACGDNVPGAIDAPVVPHDMAGDTSVPIDAPPDATLTARLRLTPSTATFGPTSINALSAPVTFVVTNEGDATSGLITKQIDGVYASAFMIAMDSCTGSLAPLQSCTLELTFQSVPGLHTASLVVSATPGGAVMAALSATAYGEQLLTSSPSMHDYGVVAAGQSSVQTFMIANQGGLPATVSTQITGADPTQFVIAGTDTCTGATLPGGAICTLTVAFSPTSVGTKTAVLTVSQPAGAAVSVAVLGTGISAHGPIATPTPYDYGDVVVGQSSTQTFTITNPGGSPITLSTVELDGPDPTHFSVSIDTCSGATVAAGATCTIEVTFSPTFTGLKVAVVRIATASAQTTISLSGTGTP